MSILAADFLKDLISRAGITESDEIKNLLLSKELSAVIPDDLAAKLKASLISVGDARQHAEVRKHLKGEFLGGFDNKVKQFAKSKLGWNDEDWREFRGSESERSISDYFDTFLEKVKEIGIREGEKSGGSGADELRKKLTEEIQKQFADRLEKNTATIRTYEEKIKALSEEKTKTESEWASRYETQERDYFLTNQMSQLPFRKELAELGMLDQAKATIIQRITQKAVLKKENGEFIPFNPQDTAARLLKENKPISIQELIKEEAAQFIDTKSGSGAGAGNGGGAVIPKVPGNNGGQTEGEKPFVFGSKGYKPNIHGLD